MPEVTRGGDGTPESPAADALCPRTLRGWVEAWPGAGRGSPGPRGPRAVLVGRRTALSQVSYLSRVTQPRFAIPGFGCQVGGR